MTPILRRFRAADLAQIKKIFTLARRQAFYWEPADIFQDDDFEVATAGELIWVAEIVTGIVAGFISIWEVDSFIHLLFVHPEYQGQGIGQALLEKSYELVPFPIRLKCKSRNERAVRFYQRNGWREVGRGQDSFGEYILFEKRARARRSGGRK